VTTEVVSLGWAAISWIEHYLVHGPGDVQGQPVELDDEFAAFIVKAYRVDPKSGARSVRRAFLSRAKGRSKSGLAAFIACFEALGPCRFDHWAEAGEVSGWGYEYDEGEPVGEPLSYVEILNVATEEGQAGNTYDAIFYMLSPETCSDELLEDFGVIDAGVTRTILPNKRGFIEPVTAANESKDGGKSTFIVADETHLWFPPTTGKFKLGKMHQTMVRNLLKRKVASGWMLETSTMYAAGERSVAEGTHDYARSLSKAGGNDSRLLFDHRQASDSWDLNKRRERVKALQESYGPAAEWMDLESIADYWDDPQASEADFRRFWLNQPVPLVDPDAGVAIGAADWLSESVRKPKAAAPVRACVVLDIEPGRKVTSVGVAGRNDDGQLVILEHTEPGESWIIDRLQSLSANIEVLEVALHPASEAKTLIPLLRNAGIEFEKLNSNDESGGCSSLIDKVANGAVVHVGQDGLDAAATRAHTRTVGGAQRWDRAKAPVPLSPLVAASTALYRFELVESEQPDDPPPDIF
jgi:hypothetical protein